MRERERHRVKPTRPFPHLIYEVLQAYGPGWYYRPSWPTSDGVVPWEEFRVASRALWALRAIERLNMARAIGVAFSGDTAEGRAARVAEAAEAFPDGKQDR